jgi:hypothetical protein
MKSPEYPNNLSRTNQMPACANQSSPLSPVAADVSPLHPNTARKIMSRFTSAATGYGFGTGGVGGVGSGGVWLSGGKVFRRNSSRMGALAGSIQPRLLFHLRPGDARPAAMGAFGPFNCPGIFHVLDRLAHPAHQRLGLRQLFVQWMIHGRFNCPAEPARRGCGKWNAPEIS